MIEARRLLEGAIDTHVHSAPDVIERKLDDLRVARQARERGMAAVVLKNHFLPTPLRARLAEAQTPGVRVLGGVVLNHPVGGMNPWAVEAAAAAGARMVWMPTAQAENQVAYQSRPGNPPHVVHLQVRDRPPAVTVFDADGAPTADTLAVLEVARDRGLALATGHLGGAEVERLAEAAWAMGLRRIVATHPDAPLIALPIALQRRLAERGMYFERTYNWLVPPYSALTAAEQAAIIRAVGVDNTILATDFGQAYNPPPVEGLEAYLAALLAEGFTPEELRRMVSDNARALLDV
jgi:hypothetical protein